MLSLLRSARVLLRTPGAAIAAAFTLALGVAACIAVFTLVNALLLKPLPYPDPEQIVSLSTIVKGRPQGGVSWQDIRDLRASAGTLDSAAIYSNRTWGLTYGDGRPPEVALSGMVTAEFFRVLGVTPVLGGAFSPEMEQRGANHVLWLTHSFWMSRYQGDPAAIGRRVGLNDVAYRIVGILPEWFHFPMRAGTPEIYIPIDTETFCCAREGRGNDSIARRKPHTTPAAMQQELQAVSARLRNTYPDTNRDLDFVPGDLQTFLAGQRTRPLLLLSAAVAMLMLVSSLNAGGILLARAAGRVREAAIRASLGAGFRELLFEQIGQGILIGVAAAAAGFCGGLLLLRLANGMPSIRWAMEGYARVHSLQPDWRVAAFGALIALCTSVAAALLPLTIVRQHALEQILRMMGSASAAPSAVRTRNFLVAAQIAMTVVLLGSGGLLLRSLWNLLSLDRGFRTGHVVMAGIGIPEIRYNTDEKMIAFHHQVLERLESIPGVSLAAMGSGLPTGPMATRFQLEGQNLPVRERPRVDVAVASPRLLPALGIPLVKGRLFRNEDRFGEPYVAMVNQAFAATYLSGRDPLGVHLRLQWYNGFAMKPWSQFEVVGVIGNTRSRAHEKAPEPMVILSATQIAMEGGIYFAVSSRDAASLTREFRQAIWSVDENIQAITPKPLESMRERGLEERRLTLWLLGWFAALALLLAGLGLGAAMAATVVETRKELAVRSALGATPWRIISRVTGKGVRIAVIGSSAGVLGMVAAGRLIENQFYGVGALDWAAATAVICLLSLVVLAACALPAARAVRIAAAEVLRG